MERGNLRYDYLSVDTKRYVNALGIIKENAYSAICFDAGSSQTLEKLLPKKDYGRYFDLAVNNPPYPVTWVEFDGLTGFDVAKCAVLVIKNEQQYWLLAFLKIPQLDNEWYFEGGVGGRLGEPQSFLISDDSEQKANSLYFEILGLFCGAMLALKCNNVEATEEKPTQLQRLRAKKQKLPIFSTWTLRIIQGAKTKSPSTGGSHASPRLHLRRGHIREYKQGCFTWVSSCVVGSVDLGVVAKDYEMAASS